MPPLLKRCAAVLTLTLLLALTPVLTHGADETKKKPLAVDDLYLLESVHSPTLFPKEDKLVYEHAWIDAKTKQERHSLRLVSDDREKRKPLEQGEPDGRAPVVSPDEQWIAFLSTRVDPPSFPGANKSTRRSIPWVPPFSDAGVDIWLYHVKSAKVLPLGGPDRRWGRVFHDGFYGRAAFSPDGRRLVFVADDGVDPRTTEELENDVEIVRPDQGEGYTGYGPAQIWIADLDQEPAQFAAKNVTRVTSDDVWYGDPQWSPDGKSLVVHANKTKDRESVRFSINKNFDLYLIDAASKKQTQLTSNAGPDVSPRFSPDGKQIAYLSSPRNGPHRDVFNIGVVTLGKDGPTVRLVLDQAKALPAYVPPANPTFPLPADCWDDNKLIFDGRGVDVKTGRLSSTVRQGGGTLAQILTPLENTFLEQRYEPRSDLILWKNDGFAIQGVFTAPPAEVAKAPHKLIVYPHGGPHGQSTREFNFTVQLFAAHGYAVFQPNFRGSTGYDKTFLDADRLDLGGGDMRDILTGIDQLVKDGKVDPKQQFIYGTSYGGFMTSWLVGHTNQFRAAVAQNAVTDMNMMYGLSDLQSWTHWELGGAPWEQPERYRKHSPLTYADKVKTPTLILHARDDRRCPLPMGKAFHQALLANDVPTQMVIYPNEGHGISSPRHREDVYRRVLAWFDKYGK
jgi:dipeptidyl aminopeptidase/acylaminoacyl peptidase